jgi:three-Cys-motif partner protein
MGSGDFHAQPYDEGTLTKLRIIELYAKEWFPVFSASTTPWCREVHVFDFFAGPGRDRNGVQGSPLRILGQLQRLAGRITVPVTAHFFDSDKRKIRMLRAALDGVVQISGLTLDIEAKEFATALRQAVPVLSDSKAAKLLFIDQCGVEHVDRDVFRLLSSAPVCDFIFFIASQTLYRFAEHQAIRLKINRPQDYYHVHRATWQHFRDMLAPSSACLLGRFSIKKVTNIYGLIFGCQHPLGMDKFLEVAWKEDEIAGEANFDIDRENVGPLFEGLLDPNKISAFEQDLEQRIRSGHVSTEADVIRICFEHGVRRKHAEPVLKRLTQMDVIDVAFRVPDVRRFREPRPVHLLNPPSS